MRDILNTIYKQMDEKQAEDARILNVSNITSIADYFVICSADNERKVKSIADAIEDELARQGTEPRFKEGFDTSRWILLDYGDIIVHVFDRENRVFYDLERIWRDGKQVDPEEL